MINIAKLYTCFVDFHKAFDSINHAALKLKLLRVGVGNRFYWIIKEMYSKCYSSVKLGSKLTGHFQSCSGGRQGDNISPHLFKIDLNNLSDIFQIPKVLLN